MNKSDLLKNIAEKGYDVGFGAKRHFATYDIIDKAPGFISFVSMAFGITALAVDGISTKLVSALFIVLGVVGLYITLHNQNKDDYAKSGTELIKLFNELKALYFTVKALDDSADLSDYQKELRQIEDRHYPLCISKQILLSNWYAHHKFYWEFQMAWLDEELHFTFFRDKVPLTFSLFLSFAMLTTGVIIYNIKGMVCALAGY